MRDTIAIELFQVGSVPFAEKIKIYASCNAKLSEGYMYVKYQKILPSQKKEIKNPRSWVHLAQDQQNLFINESLGK